MANLLVTLMDKLDVPVERLGGSTGKLPIDTLSGCKACDAGFAVCAVDARDGIARA